MIGSPFAGERMLFERAISVLASICARATAARARPSGRRRSRVERAHTSGCSWIALPSISTGSKA